jgi:hypothetical protein
VLSFDGYSNMNRVMILQNHDLIGVENINYKNETIFDRKKITYLDLVGETLV